MSRTFFRKLEIIDICEKSKTFPTMAKYARCASIKANFYIGGESTRILEEMIVLYDEVKVHSEQGVMNKVLSGVPGQRNSDRLPVARPAGRLGRAASGTPDKSG
jgi:hypothetical protein